jgi:dienelactone hydrolase
MQTEIVTYSLGKHNFKGYVAKGKETSHKKPAVIVAHAWRGLDHFAKSKAEYLAGLGYIGFAADYYGDGVIAQSDERAAELMTPLFFDRKELQNRLIAAYETVKKMPEVDPNKIAIIGFCFGGLAAIELFRSGTPIRGALTFHAVLANAKGGKKAQTVPIASGIQGSLLVLHGNDDPLVSQQDLQGFMAEMTKANVDWEIDIYGHTVHAFTNPEVHDIHSGMAFNTKANNRSWLAAERFFTEIFK